MFEVETFIGNWFEYRSGQPVISRQADKQWPFSRKSRSNKQNEQNIFEYLFGPKRKTQIRDFYSFQSPNLVFVWSALLVCYYADKLDLVHCNFSYHSAKSYISYIPRSLHMIFFMIDTFSISKTNRIILKILHTVRLERVH